MFLFAALLLVQPALWAQSDITLLATTDLDCTWKLDGKAQGALKADDAIVVPLSRGKHLVQATSADGLDQWKAVVTVTQPGQEMVEIKLKEAHQQRTSAQPISAQPAATQPAAVQPTVSPMPPAAPTAAAPISPTAIPPQPVVEPIQPAAQQPTQDPTWTDPATHLIWAASDNGKNVTWPEANNYCSSLNLAGYSNWRLPTIDELAGIYDETQDVNGWHIKGGIRITEMVWSSEAQGDYQHKAFTFHNVKKDPVRVVFSRRALCVHAPAQ
jgi:hypothetical protein